MSAAFANAVDLSALKRPAAPPAGSAPAAASGEPASVSPYVIDVDEAGFATNVIDLSANVLVIVDLWATWCEPCKQLSPLLEKLVIELNGAAVLAKVDVDANPRIAQAFQVQSIPTIVAVAMGQPVDAFSGAQPEPTLRKWLTSLLDALRDRLPGIAAAGAPAEPEPEPEDPRFVEAEDAIAAGDFTKAIAGYEAILAVEPLNSEATAALGQVRFHARVTELPEDVVALADADPTDVTLQNNAADMQLAMGDQEGAFSRLIELVRRTAGDEKAAARQHLIELFALVGNDDPTVVAARRALAAALY